MKVDRRSADAHHHLAVALSGLGRHEEAIERYQTALAISPELAEAHNNLAHSLQTLCRMEQAMEHYEKALTIRPDYPEARNNLGIALQALGRSAEAMAQYEGALATRPSYPDARKNLGNLLGAAQRCKEAAAHYEIALAARPNDAEAHVALGNMLCRLDRPEAAISRYNQALGCDPNCVEAHNGLGGALHMLGRSEEAIRQHHRALAIKPTNLDAHNRLGGALQALGRLQEANAAFEKAVTVAPNKAGCYWNLANSKRFTQDDLHFAAMKERARDRGSLTAEEQIDLDFALAKAFGDVGDQPQSFLHLIRGNSLKRHQIEYDEATTLGRLARIEAMFTAALMRDKQGLGEPSSVPVFIVGMPRSGTTLVEQVLASHPKVFGAGELRVMANIAERLGGQEWDIIPRSHAGFIRRSVAPDRRRLSMWHQSSGSDNRTRYRQDARQFRFGRPHPSGPSACPHHPCVPRCSRYGPLLLFAPVCAGA